MNKELRKSIETKLAVKIREILSEHHAGTAAEISKQISEGVKYIAKKFVKHLPGSKETATPKKVSRKPKTALKSVSVKADKKAKSKSPVKVPAKKKAAKKPAAAKKKK